MATKASNSKPVNNGCWTCRLRRKKCDEARPVCGECRTLEVTCHFRDGRPEWMDGGERQAAMADRLKAEVKRSATRRRSRRHIEALARGMEDDGGFSLLDAREAEGMEEEARAHNPAPGLASSSSPSSVVVANTKAQRDEAAVGSVPMSMSMSMSMAGSTALMTPSETSMSMTPSSQGPESVDTGVFVDSPFPGSSFSQTDASGMVDPPMFETTFDVPLRGGVADNRPSLSEAAMQAPDPTLIKEEDQFLVMTYLDYVMPFLFPLYKPSIVDGGRTWMLALLVKNSALYHTALSLSAYVFSTALSEQHSGHKKCKDGSWEWLLMQAELSIKAIQKNVEVFNHGGIQGRLLEGAQLMESVMQMLTFQMGIGCGEYWQPHMSAATTLFEQVFQHYGTVNGVPDMKVVLEKMGQLSSQNTYPKNHTVHCPDQAAFLFFGSLLLAHDIISCTALEQPPRLQAYHSRLLAPSGSPGEEPLIKLENLIGCQNWVLILIGEISALDVWKKDMRKDGRLSMMELARRASSIERRLYDGLEQLNSSGSSDPSSNPLDILALYNNQPCTADVRVTLTRIWAHAALTYLFIVVSGWQRASPDLRNNICRTIQLLSSLPSPGWLRSLAWPFCVTGCLAEAHQEQVLRDMASSLGVLQGFGSILAALTIMERVWLKREEICPDFWDLGGCFQILGHRSLLV